ncbi:pyrC, partial [Symbiodinium microadriaticum]
MPNIVPPVRTLADAETYYERIISNLPPTSQLQAMMTLYMTDRTTVEDVTVAYRSGLVKAVKLYPAGATTNSEFGVTDVKHIKAVLGAMSSLGMPLLVHGEVA